MNQLDVPLEIKLRQETTQRLLLNLYEDEDWKGLLAAAEILNQAWNQQAAISKWLAKEAADNLGEAWQASRGQHREHDGSGC